MQCMQYPKTEVKYLFYIDKCCIQNTILKCMLHTLKRMQSLFSSELPTALLHEISFGLFRCPCGNPL